MVLSSCHLVEAGGIETPFHVVRFTSAGPATIREIKTDPLSDSCLVRARGPSYRPDHCQDACLDSLRQMRPGIDNRLQIGRKGDILLQGIRAVRRTVRIGFGRNLLLVQ